MKNLEYSNQGEPEWHEARVKKTGGGSILWFQIFDQVDNKDVLNSYKSANAKIKDFPAKIYEKKWIWTLVNNRIEIRLIADDMAPEFRDTEKLKKFILSFNLSAMEKVQGPKLTGRDLAAFIPKLGDK